MMKGIITLALFACVAFAQSNHGQFFDHNLIIAFSGVGEALNNLTNFAVSDQTRKKPDWTVVSNISITNGKAWKSYANSSGIVGNFDNATTTYTYTGFYLTVNFTFKFSDPFTTAWVNGTVSGSYGIKPESFVKVTHAINETSKGPLFTIATDIKLTEPTLEFSVTNTTVQDDIKAWFSNETLNEIQQSVNNKILLNLTGEYQKEVDRFVQKVVYEFGGLSATIDYSMESLHGQAQGLKIIYNGGIENYTVPSSSIPDFDPSVGPTQVLLTKNFIEKAISYPADKGFFKWSFPDPSQLRMPDLDFKASDLYFIFPDSIGKFSATDPLKTDCNLGSGVVTFNKEANRLEFLSTLTCTVKVTPSTGSETKIMDFSVSAIFYTDISLSVDPKFTKLIVQLSDTVPQGSVKIENCPYDVQPRQQAIIDTLVQEAFEYYDSEHDVWGTNFILLPLRGAYYQVRDDGILFFGSHH